MIIHTIYGLILFKQKPTTGCKTAILYELGWNGCAKATVRYYGVM